MRSQKEFGLDEAYPFETSTSGSSKAQYQNSANIDAEYGELIFELAVTDFDRVQHSCLLQEDRVEARNIFSQRFDYSGQ